MKNKKGFTLIEMIAAIAILSMLVLLTLPNVLKIFLEAKKKSFVNEAMIVLRQSESDYIEDSLFTSAAKTYASDGNKLSLDGRDLTYVINLDRKGKVLNYVVHDDEFCIATNKDYKTLTTDDVNVDKCEITDSQKLGIYTINLNKDGTNPIPEKVYMQYSKGWYKDFERTSIFSELEKLPEKEGYTFNGYKIDEKEIINSEGKLLNVGSEFLTTTNYNVDATSMWTANEYTVTLDTNGGVIEEEKIIVTYDSVYGDLATPTKTGYDFTGWFLEDGTQITSDTIVKTPLDHTLYAHYTAKTIICEAGTYLPKNSVSCSTCIVGSYCPGGNFTFSETLNGGINICPSGYTSDAGIKAENECYINVVAGKYLTTAKTTTTGACAKGSYSLATKVKYGNTSTCTACPAGKTTAATGSTSASLCTACSSITGLATWSTQSWVSNNTVSNLCTAASCNTGYILKNGTCESTFYTATLNNQSATTAGTTAIYHKYSDSKWYTSVAGTTVVTTITKPTKTGYAFGGYFTSTNGGGTKIIDASGKPIDKITANTTLYAYWVSTTPKEDFAAGTQTAYTIPVTGIYKLEVWGSQGQTSGSVCTNSGYGGYSYGQIKLTKGQVIYVNVGNQSGYNGGGTVTSSYNGINFKSSSVFVANGGGATHIATASGQLLSLSGNKGSILIVAGGGGGAYNWHLYIDRTNAGGHAGGYVGNAGKCTTGTCAGGGSQSAGGNANSSGSLRGTAGTFGKGGNGVIHTGTGEGGQGAAGGGGYYGGGGNINVHQSAEGGGGGSGYIGNSSLTNKGMYCYQCATSSATATKTTSTTCTCNGNTHTANCARTGNGAARITLISIPE